MTKDQEINMWKAKYFEMLEKYEKVYNTLYCVGTVLGILLAISLWVFLT